MRSWVAISLAILSPTLALGEGPEAISLDFPVDCTLGETCFLQQTMDRDAGPGWRDFTCGAASYDGHGGTDIRVADLEAMQQAPVQVNAAAAGTVRAVRDGIEDRGLLSAPEGLGCGNGVAITHPDGWETQYCHLMNGSVAVAAGQDVSAGTPLGLIGYSGNTEFPHLEFILRQDGLAVDPFDPSDLAQCGLGAQPLWSQEVPVQLSGILSVGFSTGIPAFDAIKAGTADLQTLATSDPALVLWGYVHGSVPGDTLLLRIIGPDGSVVHENPVMLERAQAELFRASGRRTPMGGWPQGAYSGEVSLIRGGVVIDTRMATIPMQPAP